MIVNRLGMPLAFLVSLGNRSDRLFLAFLLDAVRPVRRVRGRPRRRPAKFHADTAYDHAVCRARRVHAVPPVEESIPSAWGGANGSSSGPSPT